MSIPSLVTYLVRSIVDSPDAVSVKQTNEEGQTVLTVHVAPGDVGKVIGRQGRTIRSLRQVVAAAADNDYRLEVDEG